MSIKSILDDVGSALKTFFTGAVKVAEAVEPFIDLAFPGLAALYNATVAAVAGAEASAALAGAQTGTGAQKLALVVSSIETSFNAYWKSIGNTTTPTQAQIEAYVNAVVASLNAIPSAATS